MTSATRPFLSIVVFVLAIGALAGCRTPPVEKHPTTAKPAIREVTLLYTNDFESAWDPIPAFWRDDTGHVGGIAQIATLIDQVRDQESLSFLFDAGDIFTGTLAKLTGGELPFELMITMGYDAMCIGNHEFEYGWEVFRESKNRAPFPVLASNVFYEGTDIPFCQPYAVVERTGFRVGVVGVFGQDAATALFPPHIAGLEVRDPVPIVESIVAKLRPEVDLVVLLTHQGHTAPMQTDDEADPDVQRDIVADIRLAGAVEGVDVLIGGHADAGQETPVIHPETGTLITQTYGQGTRLGYLKLTVDTENGGILDHEGRLLLVNSDALAPHPRVAAKLAAYRARYPEIREIVGNTADRITRRYNEESDLGNLFADIMLEHGKTDIAFAHAGGIRADLPAGPVTREDLLDAFPFTDLVYILEMRGDRIRQVLEESLSLERGMIQVAGLVLRYDISRPVGQRVVDVFVGDSPLDPSATYSVTSFDFLAHAADLFGGFDGATILSGDGPEFAELLIAHFQGCDVVENPTGGRQIPISP